jgi:pimeloyl-ACP methyl ester carboxylesterase
MARDLLVPGTGGNKLLLNGDDIGWPGELTAAGWIARRSLLSVGFEALGAKYGTPESITSVLTMEYPADPQALLPTKTTLWPGGEIKPGPVLKLAYNQFDGFDVFTYDWRQDIRHNAELLLAKLEGAPGDPWRIVAHSQGGLVVAAAARTLAQRKANQTGNGDRALSKLVSHVAFLGVPLHGTMNAADAFVNGENLAAPFAASFRRIVRTWPAIFQMLPAWPGSVREAAGAAGETEQPFNLLYDQPWAGLDMPRPMLERARLTRTAFLRAPLASMNGVKTRILQSRAYPTADHLLLRPGAPPAIAGQVAGDTLVPDDITRDMGGAVQTAVTHSVGSNGDTMVHFALATDPLMATAVKSFFAQ